MNRLLKIPLLTFGLLLLFADTAHAGVGRVAVIFVLGAFGICAVLIVMSYFATVKTLLGRVGIIVLGILLFLGLYFLVSSTIELQDKAVSDTATFEDGRYQSKVVSSS
jgi:hypothetical protein